MHNLQSIADQFTLGDIIDSNQLEGKINITYLIETSQKKYVIQKLSKIYDERIVEKTHKIHELLEGSGIQTPRLIPTNSGSYIHKEGNDLWRAYEYIENDGLQEIDVNKAEKAAKALAIFHNFTGRSNFIPQYTREEYQNLELTLSKLRTFYADGEQFRKDLAKPIYDAIFANIDKHRLPDNLPPKIIHADPAFRNFLFKDNEIVAIIDLDDLMIRNHMIDIGHALQSWCLKKPSEFLLDIFKVSVKSYNDQSDTKYDFKLYKDALCLLALDHAARYLNGVFEENYWEWDQTKYEHAYEQNLERSQGRLDYYFNIINNLK
ncbi:phosphotransferase [Candidatus Dojkabacteria bacterium]|nr:phosphotransferase [Candidatus Dojkabacteria bacterium]